jgi:hypothetical protein
MRGAIQTEKGMRGFLGPKHAATFRQFAATFSSKVEKGA